MKSAVTVVCCVLVAFTAATTADHPILKVITLLKNLKSKVEAEGTAESDKFGVFKHWCEVTTKQKSKEIAETNEDLAEYKASLEALKSEVSQLDVEIGELTKMINEKSAEKARKEKMNTGDMADYDADLTDLTNTISAIDQCLTKLGDAKSITSTGLTQTHRRLLHKVLLLSDLVLTPTQKSTVHAFLQGPNETAAEKWIARTGPDAETYRFKSGNVIELLKGLKQNFAAKKVAKETEKQNSANSFALVADSLQKEIDAADESKRAKDDSKNDKQRTIDTELVPGIAEANRVLAAATTYLDDTTTMCDEKKIQFDERSKIRANEASAMTEAIAILQKVAGVRNTSEEAEVRQNGGAGYESFLQMSRSEDPKERAINLLKTVAKNTHDSTLASMAAQLARKADGPFESIKNMIQKMVFRLMAEQRDEDEHKGWCDKELAKTARATEEKQEQEKLVSALLMQLTGRRGELNMRIKELQGLIADDQAALATATNERVEEKADYAHAVQDAKDAQAAIADAIRVLTAHYVSTGAAEAALLQGPDGLARDDAPDTWNEGYKAVEGSVSDAGNVIDLLRTTQGDYAEMQSDFETAETTGQANFDKFKTQTEVSIAGMKGEADTKGAEVQRLSADIEMHEGIKSNLDKRLELLNQYNEDLKPACVDGDSTYEDRKGARTREVEALKQALDILEQAFKQKAALLAKTHLRRHA